MSKLRPFLLLSTLGSATLYGLTAAAPAWAQLQAQQVGPASAPPAVADHPAAAPPAAAPSAPAVAPAPSAPIAGSAEAPHLDPAAPGLPAHAAAAAPAKPKPKLRKPHVAPAQVALSTSPIPSFTATTAAATEAAAQRYGAILRKGGWDPIPGPLHPGSRGMGVSILRHHLALEGDLEAAREGDPPYNQVWDKDVTEAVKHYQARVGLRPTGLVAGDTLKALNVPADARYRALLASAQRLSTVHFSFGPRYIVVNLPSASVEAVEDGKVVHRYVAIVGGADHPSPQEIAHVQAVNLNPTWTVPVSIIKNEIIPKMRKDPTYLSRERIRVLDWHGKPIDPRSIDWNTTKGTNFMLRQDSGAGNSLGSIRLNMPNHDAVYMHDTPAKGLFSRDYRFLSHGCVRVSGIYDLAAWVLEGTMNTDDGVWDKTALLEGVASQEQQEIKVSKPVPVAWVYLTGWADGSGTVQFRDDIYNLDTDPTAVAIAPTASGIDPNFQAAR